MVKQKCNNVEKKCNNVEKNSQQKKKTNARYARIKKAIKCSPPVGLMAALHCKKTAVNLKWTKH